MEQRKQGRGWHQHFLGFRPRFNCERIPVIPACVVRANFADPRKIPYLLVWLVWKDPPDGVVKEAVRLARTESCGNEGAELKREHGDATVVRTLWRTLPKTSANHCITKPQAALA